MPDTARFKLKAGWLHPGPPGVPESGHGVQTDQVEPAPRLGEPRIFGSRAAARGDGVGTQSRRRRIPGYFAGGRRRRYGSVRPVPPGGWSWVGSMMSGPGILQQRPEIG